jgi:hypothetical protein
VPVLIVGGADLFAIFVDEGAVDRIDVGANGGAVGGTIVVGGGGEDGSEEQGGENALHGGIINPPEHGKYYRVLDRNFQSHWGRAWGSTDGSRPKVALQDGFGIDFDSFRILADVTDVIDSSGQGSELPVLDGFEIADSDFGGFGDLTQGNPLLVTQGR